jgi:hypothetical protein
VGSDSDGAGRPSSPERTAGSGYATAKRLLRDGFALGYATQDTWPAYEEPKQRLDKLGTVHWVSGDLADLNV